MKLLLVIAAGLLVAGVVIEAGARGALRGRGGVFLTPPITSVSIGAGFSYLTNYGATPSHYMTGDSWVSTWGDNGTTYMTANDASLPDSDWNATNQHIVVSTMTLNAANPPAVGNPLLSLGGNEIKLWGSATGPVGSDNMRFKSTGLLCLPGTPNGTLYLNTRRYWQVTPHNSFWYSQVIKSTDYANTWSPLPPGAAAPSTVSNNPYNPAMFQSMNAYTLAGYFQYGQCNAGAGTTIDNSSNYAYAFISDSNDGTDQWQREWLARVPITAIGNLSASDWQFYTGPVGGDGVNTPANWASTFSTTTAPIATVIIDATSLAISGGALCCSQGAVYLPRYQQYLHVTAGGGASPHVGGFFWTAPHPWGPWTLSGQSTNFIGGWSDPVISSLVNGGQTLWVAVAGDPGTGMNPATSTYTMYIYPMTITP